MPREVRCCKHPAIEHVYEHQVSNDTDSRRELCLMCPGYEEPGYPNGKAWHRYRKPLPRRKKMIRKLCIYCKSIISKKNYCKSRPRVCNLCHAKYNRAYYKKNLKYSRKLKRRRGANDRSKNRKKYRVRALVAAAVRLSILKRPKRCSECRTVPKPRIDGRSMIHAHHHKGYDKPLDVIWLCAKCHGRKHYASA